jgi:hypothetical protein
MSGASGESTVGFFDAPVPFEEPAAWVGPEIDMPNVIVDVLERTSAAEANSLGAGADR